MFLSLLNMTVCGCSDGFSLSFMATPDEDPKAQSVICTITHKKFQQKKTKI